MSESDIYARLNILPIKCPIITLRKNLSDPSGELRGNGTISISEDRKLQVEVNISTADYSVEDVLTFCRIGKLAKTKQPAVAVEISDEKGKILEDEEYLSFLAEDSKSRVWQTEKIISSGCFSAPVFSEYVTLTFGIESEVSSVTSSISKESVCSEDSSLLLLLNEKLELPLLWNVMSQRKSLGANILADRASISLIQQDKRFLIRFLSVDLDKLEKIEHRLCEALQFLLAQPVSWSCLRLTSCDREEIRIRPLFTKSKGTKGTPPIDLSSIYPERDKQLFPEASDEMCSGRQLWCLFETYLSYTLTDAQYDIHPISGWMSRFIEVSQQSLEAKILTISIAIESIVNEYFRHLEIAGSENNEKPDHLNNVTDLRAWMESTELRESFCKRLNGFLSSLGKNNTRAIDRLSELVNIGLLKKTRVEAWKEARNSAAHGYVIEQHKITKHLRRHNEITVLFFQLVFIVIGYEGAFSDYAKPGWPLRSFQGTLSEAKGESIKSSDS